MSDLQKLRKVITAFNMQHLTNDIMEIITDRRVAKKYATLNAPVEEIKPKERMPLTLEEKATLETLTGKAKKSYVKELKAKYEAP